MFQLLTIYSLLIVCIKNVNSGEICEVYTINGLVYQQKYCGIYCCGFCGYRYCCEYSQYRLENQESCKPPENCSSYYASNGSVQKENDCGDMFCCGSCKTRYCCNAAKNRLNQSKCSNHETTKKTTTTTYHYNNNNNIPLILALTIPICVFVIILTLTLFRYAQQNRCDYTTNSNVSYPRLTTINRSSDYPANFTQPNFIVAHNSACNFDMNMNKIYNTNVNYDDLPPSYDTLNTQQKKMYEKVLTE